MSRRYLIDEQPLIVLPTLAIRIGLNEAVFLQQLHYWLRKSKHQYDSIFWIYNTYENWSEQFPFWSIRTIQRIVKSLEDTGIIITSAEFNNGYNNTKWYRIDYDRLYKLTGFDNHSELIVNEKPLIFQATLAAQYSLNEAIFLQQLHYCLIYSQLQQENINWVANSYKCWLNRFTFWNSKTLQRVISSLTQKQLVISTNKYGNSMNQARWLSINYDKIILVGQNGTTAGQNVKTSGQFGTTSMDNLALRKDNLALPLYNDSETNTDRKTERLNSESQSSDLIPKSEIQTVYNTAFQYYSELIDESALSRINKNIENLIEKAIRQYGVNVAELLFDAVKRSDYLLSQKTFTPKFRWLFSHIDQILDGKYDSDGLSLFEKAVQCCAKEEICHVIKHGNKSLPECRYCEIFRNRPVDINNNNQINIVDDIESLQQRANECSKRYVNTAKTCFHITHNRSHRDSSLISSAVYCKFCELFQNDLSDQVGVNV